MDKPKCFGVWWEAVSGPVGDNCRQCAIQDDCLHEFATTRLKETRELNPGASLSGLSGALEVDERAVLLAMAHADRPHKPKPSKQTPVKIEEKSTTTKPAESKKKTKKKRKTKKKPRKRTWSWSEETFEKRWNSERERNPIIAQLTPGTKLEREYKGKTYTALVKTGGYLCEDQFFPTLHTLTQHVAGPGARRNSVKFWGLSQGD